MLCAHVPARSSLGLRPTYTYAFLHPSARARTAGSSRDPWSRAHGTRSRNRAVLPRYRLAALPRRTPRWHVYSESADRRRGALLRVLARALVQPIGSRAAAEPSPEELRPGPMAFPPIRGPS